MKKEERRKIRGQEMAMIFQDALSSLNPVLTVGEQLGEMYVVHRGMSRKDAKAKAVELMDRVRIPAAKERVGNYPHQFSGGMRQRIMIAMALALEPSLIIADEPTTALDVTVQAQVMDLLAELQRELNMGLILITHDLGVVADVADKIAVMYAGRIVETSPVHDIYKAPAHPYTKGGLLASIPRLDQKARSCTRSRACRPTCCTSRPAAPSTRAARWPRTSAAPTCRRCTTWPSTDRAPATSGRRRSMHADHSGGRKEARAEGEAARDLLSKSRHESAYAGGEPILEVRDLVKHYPLTQGILIKKQVGAVKAVDGGVSFDLGAGETLGVVGGSPAAASRRSPGSSSTWNSPRPAPSGTRARTSPSCPAAR